MRVSWHRSLSAKLFFLMGTCLLISISGISLYHNAKFKDYLDRTLEEGTVQRAKDVANTIGGMLDYWASLTSVVMHTLASTPEDRFEPFLASFVSSNTEVVAFEVLRGDHSRVAFAFTEYSDDVRFKDAKIDAVKQNLGRFARDWVTDLSKQAAAGSGLYLSDLAPVTGLPLMAIAMRYTKEGSALDFWTVLAVWQTRLLEALPNQGTIKSSVVDQGARVLFSPAEVKKEKRGEVDKALATMLKAEQAPLGFRHYEGKGQVPMLASFARLERYRMAVVVTQDARQALSFIDKIVDKTLLWSWVYVLAFVMVSYVAASRVTRRLTTLSEATQRIASGDFSVEVAYRGGDEVAGLSTAVQHMAGQIKDLLEAKVNAARQEKELETAKLVQETFIPRQDYHSPFLHITGTSRPASECGGDWWGHFVVDERFSYLVVADATGHGVGAALVTAMAFSGFQTLLEILQEQAIRGSTPAQMLRHLHRVLMAAGSGSTSMTCFVAMIDRETGRMDFASGGHNPPVLLPTKLSAPERPTDMKFIGTTPWESRFVTLRNKSSPLGVTDESEFIDNYIQLKPGDKIVLYTDGIVENCNAEGKAWGQRSFRLSVMKHVDQTVQSLKQNVLDDAARFFGSMPGEDDMTIVVVEVDPLWEAKSLQEAS